MNTGAEMERWAYQRPLELVAFPEPAHFVVLADYVTTDDGTGLVHQAPAFGEDDMLVCRAYGLPFVNPIRKDGTFEPDLDLVGGAFFRDANAPILDDLAARGILFRKPRENIVKINIQCAVYFVEILESGHTMFS